MNSMIRRFAAFVLAVLLLTASAALADLERGDKGAEVSELQQLLFETGWLFELPDGAFGKRTEAAVKQFEEYAGLPVDGVADEEMILALAASLEELNNANGVVSEYFGKHVVGYFTGSPDDGEYWEEPAPVYAQYCHQWTDEYGYSVTDHCWKHHELWLETHYMLESFDAKTAQEATEMWIAEVNELYDKWMQLLPEEERESVIANRAMFLASVEAQRAAYGIGEQSVNAVIKAEAGISQTLNNQAVWLCSMIWELEKASAPDDEAIVLNGALAIDGDIVYYAGEIAGEGCGIYAMDADGSNRRKISDIQASIRAVSNGNLLVWRYEDYGYAAMEVLCADGSLATVGYSNPYAIAQGGRFYFGGSSVAEDGTDHQWVLSSDPEYHDRYYPVHADEEYLYFLYTDNSEMEYSPDDSFLPYMDVELNRLHFATGEVQLLSGVGTTYIGIEDGFLYYTLSDLEFYDEDGGAYTIDVEDGLYAMDLETLAETKIAQLTDQENVYDEYLFLEDGIFYILHWDFTDDKTDKKILRRKVNGEELPAFELGDRDIFPLCVVDGAVYGIQTEVIETEEYWFSKDEIVCFDPHTGGQTNFALEENEVMFYTELMPKVAVANGRIYYYALNEETNVEAYKCMAMNGSDVKTLAAGDPLY